MGDKPFQIPRLDADLLHESEGCFYVESTSESPDDYDENNEAFETALKHGEWWKLDNFFVPIFSMILNHEVGNKNQRVLALKLINRGMNDLTRELRDTFPDFLGCEATADATIVEVVGRLKRNMPMYLYLFCRLLTVLEAEYSKSPLIEKKKNKRGNDRSDFAVQFVNLRATSVDCLKDLATTRIGGKSAITQLFSPNAVPEGIPRIITQAIVKLLSSPENQSARGEIRQLYTPIFSILGFIGFEWKCAKKVTLNLLEKIHTWDYFKKVTSFIFLPAILDIEAPHSTYFLQSILRYFVQQEKENRLTQETARAFSLFLTTLAEKNPDFVVQNFQDLSRFLNSDQSQIRSSVLNAVEATITYYFRHNLQEQEDKFIMTLLYQLQLYMTDANANVRNRAISVLTHLMTEPYLSDEGVEVEGDRKNRRFPRKFYAYGFVQVVSWMLVDPLISVRKAASHAVYEILLTNPFAPDLNIERIHASYVVAMKKLNDIEKQEDPEVSNLQMLSARTYKHLLPIVQDYMQAKEFPLLTEDIADCDFNTKLLELGMRYQEEDDKLKVVLETLDFCFLDLDMRKRTAEEIADAITMRFVGLSIFTEFQDGRAELAAQEKEIQKKKKVAELEANLNSILETAHFAMMMQECMNKAVVALKKAQAAEVPDLVKFVSTCRQFKLKGSESALMQICTLIYRDQDARMYVIKAGKDAFFSSNSDEKVSEKSTVQNLMQVIQNASLQDRSILMDTLVYVFKHETLKPGSINFLWDTAQGTDIDLAVMALQILNACALADPKDIQKRFAFLVSILEKGNSRLCIEAVQVASSCGTATISAELTDDVATLVKPSFRLPSNNDFFKHVTNRILNDLFRSKVRYWPIFVKRSLQAVYNLCEEPDELATTVLSTMMLRAKHVNSTFRVTRRLLRLVAATIKSIRQNLNEKRIDTAFVHKKEGLDVKFVKLSETFEKMDLNSTQHDVTFDASEMENHTDDVELTYDSLNPFTHRCYDRFRVMKRKTVRRKTDKHVKHHRLVKWILTDGLSAETINQRLQFDKDVSPHHLHSLLVQYQVLFSLMRDLRAQWQLVWRRVFFFAKEYVTRTLSFVHENTLGPITVTNKVLEEIRKMPHGKIKLLDLATWRPNSHLSAISRDSLLRTSVYECKRSRMEEAVEQSLDTIVSSQIEAAVGWDFLKPDSVTARLFPIACQFIRFRNRPPINQDLSDAAVYFMMKLMLASPNICRRFLISIYRYMKTARMEARANIMTMFADIAIRHPPTFSARLDVFLSIIHDISPKVRYTGLLMINYLTTYKAIQLSDFRRAQIAMLLIDSDETVAELARHFFYESITVDKIPITGLINDVINRLFEYEIKEFDFRPIVDFFFEHVQVNKDCETLMNSLCSFLANAARNPFDYNLVFASQIVYCMSLLPRVTLKMVQRMESTLDKWKTLLRRKAFYKQVHELAAKMRKGQVKIEIKNAVEELETKLKLARSDARKNAKYDYRRKAAVDEEMTEVPESPAESMRMEQDEQMEPSEVMAVEKLVEPRVILSQVNGEPMPFLADDDAEPISRSKWEELQKSEKKKLAVEANGGDDDEYNWNPERKRSKRTRF